MGARSAAYDFASDKPGGGCHITMRGDSIAKAISGAVACGGLAVAVGAAVLGTQSPYRDVLIVAGIDALVIGVAAFLLVMIFLGERPAAAPAKLKPRMRSLDSPEGHELKHMLVRFVSSDKPVTIGFPADDPEAEQFAAQISQFLQDNSFRVVGFAAASPTVRLEPGIGIDEDNHILVGPIGSLPPAKAPARPPAPAARNSAGLAPAEALQASRANSP